MINRFIKKYDWIKIGGLLLILLVDVLVVAGIVSLWGGCTDKSKAAAANAAVSLTDTTEQNRGFILPVIPATITEPSARAEYLVSHWWNSLNFTDTVWLSSPDPIEQAFVDYIVLFPHTTPETVAASIGGTLEKSLSTPAVHDWFREIYEKYLYDPNSPFRNEEVYAVVLESIINNPAIEEINKARPAFQLDEINKNRQGAIAADFGYILTDGTKGRLHGIRADYTLLFFYDPGCGDCKRTKGILENTKVIADMVEGGKLKIVALYTDDNFTEWEDYHPAISKTWINARDGSKDQDIKNKLYAIRAIPSLYLLDRDKRVVLKDATAEQVINVLGYGF